MSHVQATDSRPAKVIGAVDPTTGLFQCCLKAIDLHADRNHMMVCSGCQQTIKCFKTEREFRNYRVFCESRNRDIKIGKYKERYVVVFYSYIT